MFARPPAERWGGSIEENKNEMKKKMKEKRQDKWVMPSDKQIRGASVENVFWLLNENTAGALAKHTGHTNTSYPRGSLLFLWTPFYLILLEFFLRGDIQFRVGNRWNCSHVRFFLRGLRTFILVWLKSSGCQVGRKCFVEENSHLIYGIYLIMIRVSWEMTSKIFCCFRDYFTWTKCQIYNLRYQYISNL